MKIYKADGSIIERQDAPLSSEDAQEIIGGSIEILVLKRGLLVLSDENNVKKGLPLNSTATFAIEGLTHFSHRFYGTVIVCRQEDFGFNE